MDLKVTSTKSADYVTCPHTKSKTNTSICLACQYLRIVRSDVVKCGYYQIIENENLANTNIIPRSIDGLRYGF